LSPTVQLVVQEKQINPSPASELSHRVAFRDEDNFNSLNDGPKTEPDAEQLSNQSVGDDTSGAAINQPEMMDSIQSSSSSA